MKKLIIFDLDETLAPSKSPVDKEMGGLLVKLLNGGKKVAVISGGFFKQFEKQVLPALVGAGEALHDFFIFPTCGAAFFRFKDGSWQEVYAEKLGAAEKEKISDAFELAFSALNYKHPDKVYGEVIEDRATQITFSAFGQQAPIEIKQAWDPAGEKRFKIIGALAPHLSEFDINIGGTTSIDVTRKGIDKAYGIKKMEEHLGVSKKEMLFVGDKIYPGGNDYPAKLAGVDCVSVKNPEDTKKVIVGILKS